MEIAPLITSLVYQALTAGAFLVLCSIGLMIVLGMMNIINLAHGEIMMIGAYVASLLVTEGLPFFLTLPFCFLVGVLVGLVIEFLFIRYLYSRILSALVVTWGLGLIIAQGTLLIFGPFLPSIKIPFGSIEYGGFTYSVYQLFLILVAVLLVAMIYFLLQKTELGLKSRATMQNPEIASTIGINKKKMFSITFAFGAGLAALAGGVLAPTTTIAPFMGTQFVAPAFITVVVGGATNIITGTLYSAGSLAAIRTPIGMYLGSFAGTVGLFFAALILIRLYPNGLASIRFFGRR
ncbi:MAG: branched-chain amino acid ABC transporter permease [Deltaproteobacteria bacterium]|jgi:branched-subunit amino acid ABC-type transport system permease component|nr:branched-chain amino acid ABC transporter permease [Deltaproteobacteria bacterium]